MTTPIDHGRAMTDDLFSAFAAALGKAPGRAILCPPGGADWTADQLLAESGRLAGVLAAQGVGAGDRVAVQVEKSPANVALYLAVLRLGAVYLPMNTAYTRDEVQYILEDGAPKAVVTDPALPAMRVAEAAGIAHILTLTADGTGSLTNTAPPFDAPPAAAPDADQAAAILYTSGTTGRPKGAVLTHRNLSSNARTLYEAWRFREGDVLLHALPVFHAHGLFVALNCALLGAHPMIFLPRFDIDEVIAFLPKASIYMGVPTHYTRLLADDRLDRGRCQHMRLFVSGSAPLPAPVFTQFTARTGHEILERYGMTETAMNAANPYDGPRKPGSVGPPLPGIDIRVTDEDGTPVEKGDVGMVEVRGPNVFSGYWRKPEETADVFRPDGHFITGDMGRFDEEGYLHLVGRAKEMIISGGYNVYPAEVEAVLLARDDVADAAVFGLDHPDLGEAVAAAVVPRKERTIAPEALMTALKETLASYKVPKRIFVVDSLPRNTMGKVLKPALQTRFAGTFPAQA